MSSKWVDVGDANDLSESEPLAVFAEGLAIVVVRCGESAVRGAGPVHARRRDARRRAGRGLPDHLPAPRRALLPAHRRRRSPRRPTSRCRPTRRAWRTGACWWNCPRERCAHEAPDAHAPRGRPLEGRRRLRPGAPAQPPRHEPPRSPWRGACSSSSWCRTWCWPVPRAARSRPPRSWRASSPLPPRRVLREEALYLAAAAPTCCALVQRTGPRIAHLLMVGPQPGRLGAGAAARCRTRSAADWARRRCARSASSARAWSGIERRRRVRQVQREAPPARLFGLFDLRAAGAPSALRARSPRDLPGRSPCRWSDMSTPVWRMVAIT